MIQQCPCGISANIGKQNLNLVIPSLNNYKNYVVD